MMRRDHGDAAYIEMEFYGRPAGWTGQPNVRMASELDTMELMVSEDVFLRTAPLVERLRRRTIGRRHYRLLCAVMVENAMRTGQVDETEAVLRVLAKHWTRCPARYLTLPWPRP
jgi:hypothetical protein